MSGIDDGGPAFPCEVEMGEGPQGTPKFEPHQGITARDYFAAHAPDPDPEWCELWAREHLRLKGFHGAPPRVARLDPANRLEMLAEWRFAYADAMMAARRRKP